MNRMGLVTETPVQLVIESASIFLQLPEEEAMSHGPLSPDVAQSNDSNGNSELLWSSVTRSQSAVPLCGARPSPTRNNWKRILKNGMLNCNIK